jgi:integrase
MSLHKPKNSSCWHYQFQVNGKRYCKSTRTANKTRALQVEREKRNEVHGRVYLGEAESITVGSALIRYIDARKDTSYYKGMEGIARKTSGYKLHPKTHAKISCYGLPSDMLLHEIQTKDIERLVHKRKEEGDKPATIKHEIGLIRSCMNEMAKLGYKTNRDIIYPTLKTSYRLRYLDFDEELALLRELDIKTLRPGIKPLEAQTSEMRRNLQDNYDLVVFLLDTGCRYSEVANIPWSAINIEDGTINLYRSKVGNEDVLHLSSRLRQVLEKRYAERRQGSRYVFENKAGKERGYCTQAIKKAIDRAGLNNPDVIREKGGKVTMHTLRHSFASKLIKKGVSLFQVSVLLGHSDPKMTQRYAHLAPNDASQIAVRILDAMHT